MWEAERGNFGLIRDRYDFTEATTYEEMKTKLQSGFPGNFEDYDTQLWALHSLVIVCLLLVGYKTVFIKELAKLLGSRIEDPTFIPQDCVHTFLIRHPIKKLKSFVTILKQALAEIPGE